MITTIISAFVGSFGFSLMFRLRGKKLFWATLGGGLTWILYVILEPFVKNIMLLYLFTSIFATFYAEIMARINKSPATCFIMPAAIPLIPGASLYYTMEAVVSSDMTAFYYHLENTIYMSLGVACGVVICSVLFKYIHKYLNHLSFKKRRNNLEEKN